MTVIDFTRRRFFKAMVGAAAAFKSAGLLARTVTLPSPEFGSMAGRMFIPTPDPAQFTPRGWFPLKPISMTIVNPKAVIRTHDPDIVKLNPAHHNDFQTERLCAYIKQRQQDQITYHQILNLYYEAEVKADG